MNLRERFGAVVGVVFVVPADRVETDLALAESLAVDVLQYDERAAGDLLLVAEGEADIIQPFHQPPLGEIIELK